MKVSTDLGTFCLEWSDEGLTSLSWICGDLSGSAKAPPFVLEAARRLKLFAEGKRVDFSDMSLDLGGLSPFARRVLGEVRKIPYGEVRTYSEIARFCGLPRAQRAVGAALAKNPLPIIIPCHRVVAKGEGLGGYSGPGGVEMKKRLLALEKAYEAPAPRRP